jgi:hypothetical protein
VHASGKTIQAISLILANRKPDGEMVSDLKAKGKATSVVTPGVSNLLKIKATLVICPGGYKTNLPSDMIHTPGYIQLASPWRFIVGDS